MTTIHELTSDECARLLRHGDFGRVGLTGPRGPEIIPVNYRVVDDAIMVRTERESILCRYAVGSPLVFEVDGLDRDYWQGWSVVARGIGRRVDFDEAGPRLPRPWPGGDKPVVIRLPWTELTGRRLT